jgi:broad specificity phosphatase PhoE
MPMNFGLRGGKRALDMFSGEPRAPLIAPVHGGGDMHRIMIIRHGSTDLNDSKTSVDRIRGWKDIPLNEEGRAEAHKMADKLAKKPPDVLLTSDLKRASETAHIVSARIGVPVSERSEGFRPWNVGTYAGKLSSEAVPILSDYAKNKPDEKVPGGESFNDFKHRFFDHLAETLDKYNGNHVAIVTHYRNERLLEAWKAKGFPKSGEIDRKVFAEKGPAPAHVTEISIPRSRLETGPSMTKAEADYMEQSDKAYHCKDCSMFLQPDSCTLVMGKINADGWCKHYEGK